MANDYAAVWKVTNAFTKKRNSRGITLLRVESGETYRSLLEPKDISSTLWNYTIKHYVQANDTVFGNRDMSENLTADLMKTRYTTRFWTGCLNTSMNFRHHKNSLENLRTKVTADLSPEADRLPEPMMLTEWRFFPQRTSISSLYHVFHMYGLLT